MFQRAETAVVLTGHTAIRAFFEPAVAADGTVQVAHVDDHARCIHLGRYPRDTGGNLPVAAIMRDAAELGSSGIVLAHEHGNNPLPATARGWAETRRLADATDLIQVTLLDHLVFNGGECLSLRRAGAL
jgi:hypothetical protein